MFLLCIIQANLLHIIRYFITILKIRLLYRIRAFNNINISAMNATRNFFSSKPSRKLKIYQTICQRKLEKKESVICWKARVPINAGGCSTL